MKKMLLLFVCAVLCLFSGSCEKSLNVEFDPKIILKSHMPEDEIEALAKCFLPDILDFFESEEGRKEFEQWKKEQSEKSNK